MAIIIKCLFQTVVFALFVMGSVSFASAAEIVDVKMPKELSPQAQWGALAFDQNCAACHGKNGSGTDQGPPFIHTTYNPGHHGDEAFYRAIKSGVQQHHWSFGNMPPRPEVNLALAEKIIKFIREVQLENGIVYKPHVMQ